MASIKSLTTGDVALLTTLAALKAINRDLAITTSDIALYEHRSVDALGHALNVLYDKGFVSKKPKKGKKGGYNFWYLNASGRKYAVSHVSSAADVFGLKVSA